MTAPIEGMFVEAGVQTAGLDQGIQHSIALIDRFGSTVSRVATGLPPLTLQTEPITRGLAQTAERLSAVITGTRTLGQLEARPSIVLDTRQAQAELGTLERRLGTLLPSLERIDPSGVTRLVTEMIQGALTELQSQLERVQADVTRQGGEAGAAYVQAFGTHLSGLSDLQGAAAPPVGAGATHADTAAQAASVSETAKEVTYLTSLNREFESAAAKRAAATAGTTRYTQSLTANQPVTSAATQAAAVLSNQVTILSGQLNILADRAIPAVTGSTSRMIAGMSAASGASDRMIAGMSAAGVAAAGAARGTELLGSGSDAAGRGTQKLQGALTVLALQASGTNRVVGQLVSGLLLIGGGNVVVLAIAAIAAASAQLYAVLTAGERRVREEREKRAAGLSQRVEAAQPELLTFQRQLAAAEGERALKAREIAAAEANLAAGTLPLIVRFLTLRQLAGDRLDLAKRTAEVQQGSVLLGELTAAGERAALDFQRQRLSSRIETVAAAPALRTATGASEREVNALLALQAQILRSGTASQEERNLAARNYVTLLDSTLVRLERDVGLSRQATSEAVEGIQRVLAQRQDLAQPVPVRIATGDALAEVRQLREHATEDLAAVTDALARMAARGQETTPAFTRLAQAARGLRGELAELGTLQFRVEAAPVERMVDAVTTLTERLAVLRERGLAGVGAESADVSAATSDLVRRYADLIESVARLGGVSAATTATLRALATAGDRVKESAGGQAQGVFLAAGRLAEAQARLREFNLQRDQPPAIRAKLELDVSTSASLLQTFLREQQAKLDANQLQLRPAFDASAAISTAPNEQQLAALGKNNLDPLIRGLLESSDLADRLLGQFALVDPALRRFLDHRSDASRLADEMQRVAEAVGAITGALARTGEQTGIFTGDTVRALRDIEAISQDIDSVLESIKSGNPLGVIVGGINLIGSIGGALGIGKSPEEARSEAVTRENTVALERFTRTLGNVRIDVQGEVIGKLQTAFATVTDPAKFLLEDNTKLGNRVNDLLKTYGLSMDDVIATADAMGITFQNTADFYAKFPEVLAQASKAITSFGDSLSEQTQRAELGSRIRGEAQDPAAVFERTLGVFDDFSPAIQRAFAGVELDSREGVRAAMLKLFEALETGALTAEDMGLSKDEFLDFLDKGATYLESFDQGLQDATKVMGNIPDTFKVAQAEFAARSGERLPPELAGRALPPGREIGDVVPELPVVLTELPERIGQVIAGLPVRGEGAQLLADRLTEFAAGGTLGGVTDTLRRFLEPAPLETARPITEALGILSGGATLRDLLERLASTQPAPPGPGPGPSLVQAPASPVYVSSMVFNIQGAGKDPVAVARETRAVFDRDRTAGIG